jgi:hypothetical protein
MALILVKADALINFLKSRLFETFKYKLRSQWVISKLRTECSAIFLRDESFLFCVVGDSTVASEGRVPHFIKFFTNTKDLFEKRGM